MRFIFPIPLAVGRPPPVKFLDFVRALPAGRRLTVSLFGQRNSAIVVAPSGLAADDEDLSRTFDPAGMSPSQLTEELIHRTAAILADSVRHDGLLDLQSRRHASVPLGLARQTRGLAALAERATAALQK